MYAWFSFNNLVGGLSREFSRNCFDFSFVTQTNVTRKKESESSDANMESNIFFWWRRLVADQGYRQQSPFGYFRGNVHANANTCITIGHFGRPGINKIKAYFYRGYMFSAKDGESWCHIPNMLPIRTAINNIQTLFLNLDKNIDLKLPLLDENCDYSDDETVATVSIIMLRQGLMHYGTSTMPNVCT